MLVLLWVTLAPNIGPDILWPYRSGKVFVVSEECWVPNGRFIVFVTVFVTGMSVGDPKLS